MNSKDKKMEEQRQGRIPSPWLALTPVAVLVCMLSYCIRLFKSDTLSGASQIVLLTATAVCCLIGMVGYGTKWKAIESAIVHGITSVSTALLILLLIGALSGSWMNSGIIPTLICYGVQVISPQVFLFSTCAICAVVSVMTGSSWSTIATIGVALYGVGKVEGFSDGWIAGAIISGAYFGDKISPLSDTTILSSSVTGTPLFTHIRYMLITTVPSMIIALTVFLIAGLTHTATLAGDVSVYTSTLKATYHITPWLLWVPVFMGFLISRKMPPLVTLFLSVLAASLTAVVFQPEILCRTLGQDTPVEGTSVFKGLMITLYDSTQIATGNEILDKLVTTRGMSGMLNTIWLIICAMCFGGAMTATRMLESITAVFRRFMKRTAGFVASTVFSGLFLNICMADQYLSIILTGNMFKNIFKEKGYESRLLSRTLEDGVTVTSPLVPWNTCGMTQATVLGVSTFTYLPYCIFNLVSPFMSIIIAMTGFKIKRMTDDEREEKN